VNNPFFWLGFSILLVAISLMALLTVAILILQELARAARSAEKLLDMLSRELPATLQDLRLTGKELSVLSDEVSTGMQSARSVVQQVDQGLLDAKAKAQKAQVTTRSLLAGATAALRVLAGQPKRRRTRPPTPPTPPSTNISKPSTSQSTTHPPNSATLADKPSRPTLREDQKPTALLYEKANGQRQAQSIATPRGQDQHASVAEHGRSHDPADLPTGLPADLPAEPS
jgi:cell division septum initiation protein DivIVA